ncbi:MAG: GHKL domain-containing protein [Magnetococcales bacterium]|nr:GHKL domain-containing protein [Magnetococcales bacterium]
MTKKDITGVILISSTLFCIELGIMLLFDYLQLSNPWMESLLDALFVTFVSTIFIQFYHQIRILSLPNGVNITEFTGLRSLFSGSIIIFAKFAVSVFLTESFIMILLPAFSIKDNFIGSVLDASLLALVCGPISYAWLTNNIEPPKMLSATLKKQTGLFLFIFTPLITITAFILLAFFYSETIRCGDNMENHAVRNLVTTQADNISTNRVLFSGYGRYGLLFSCLVILFGMVSWNLSVSIMKRKDAQADLEKNNRELEELVLSRTKQLVHADRLASLGTFASGMAHEINNPNSFISGNIACLKQFWNIAHPLLKKHQNEDPSGRIENFLDEVDKSLDDMMNGSKRISIIIDSLKKYAKSGMGIDKAECRLLEPVLDAKHILVHRLKDGTQITLHIPDSLVIVCDRQQISQVFINLINNSMDAMDESGMTQDREVIIQATREENYIWIRVKDNGPGIPETIIDNIFDPFYTSKGKTKGTGLGLSIVHGIIQDHAGQITVSSAPGEGTEFLVILPDSQTYQEIVEGRKKKTG